jgi:hypothetical protein
MGVETLCRWKAMNAVAVASTGSAVSDGIDVRNCKRLGISYQATSATGTPNVRVLIQTSNDDVSANYVQPENVPDVKTVLNDQLLHNDQISMIPMSFMRVKVIGNPADLSGSPAVNPADTLVTVILQIIE